MKNLRKKMFLLIVVFVTVFAIFISINLSSDTIAPRETYWGKAPFSKLMLSDLYSGLKKWIRRTGYISATIHVALCDNKYQGIQKVPAFMGNGDRPYNNLYWGLSGGTYEFFARCKWKLVKMVKRKNVPLLRLAILKKRFYTRLFPRGFDFYLILKGYRGRNIGQAAIDYIRSTYGGMLEKYKVAGKAVLAGGYSSITGFVGHNYFLDIYADQVSSIINVDRSSFFRKSLYPKATFNFSCINDQHLKQVFKRRNIYVLALTRNLLFPGGFLSESVLRSIALQHSYKKIFLGVARAYKKYLKCSFRGACNTFTNPSRSDF